MIEVLSSQSSMGFVLLTITLSMVVSTVVFSGVFRLINWRKSWREVGNGTFAVGLIGSALGLFASIGIGSAYDQSRADGAADAFHERYADVGEIHKDGERVDDIDEYVREFGKDTSYRTDRVSLVMNDGTDHLEVYALFEKSEKDHISHTVSLATLEEGGSVGFGQSVPKSQLTELSTGENLAKIEGRGFAPAVGFDEDGNVVSYAEGETFTSSQGFDRNADTADDENTGAEQEQGFWDSALNATITVVVGAAVLVLTVLFSKLAVKGTKKRADRVREKLRKKSAAQQS